VSKAKMGTPPKKPQSIGEWYQLGPSSKVTRADLLMVLQGFDFIPAEQIGQLIQNALILERERKWYHRLWRWVKASIGTSKTLKDLSPAARAKVRAELDVADAVDEAVDRAQEPDSPPVVSAGVAKQIKEADSATP